MPWPPRQQHDRAFQALKKGSLVLYLQPTCPKPSKGPFPQLSVVFPQSPPNPGISQPVPPVQWRNPEVHTGALPPCARSSRPSRAQHSFLPRPTQARHEALPASQPPRNTVPSLSELWLGSQPGPTGGPLPHLLLPGRPLRQRLPWSPGMSEGEHMT